MGERRSHTALVRLTEKEWEAWTEGARAAGYGRTAAWVRSVVAAQLDAGGVQHLRTGGSTSAHGDLRAVAGQLARIGSNLNQITRALHIAMDGGGPKLELAEVERVVEATGAELRALREACDRGQE